MILFSEFIPTYEWYLLFDTAVGLFYFNSRTTRGFRATFERKNQYYNCNQANQPQKYFRSDIGF